MLSSGRSSWVNPTEDTTRCICTYMTLGEYVLELDFMELMTSKCVLSTSLSTKDNSFYAY